MSDETQRHRGPDASGRYADPHGRAELWFRRLAIIDLSEAGCQPMTNEDKTVWLIFNGEIYNYRPLREELQARGHQFGSQTDSEVLIHLWETYGRDMLRYLNGMFAFCIWDSRTGEAFLARDHAGIKPLYYADTQAGFAFASEAKVLLTLPGLDRSVDTVALQQFMTFLWVPGTRTMWKGISKLAPGAWMHWRNGAIEHGTWWDWDQSEKDTTLTAAEWAGELRTTLLDTVQRQLMSDVPLGATVSGGLDSSAIAGAMRALHPNEPIRAYTARIEGESPDGFVNDLGYARLVGEHLKLDLVEEDIAPSITELLPLLVWQADEPLADPAMAASYLLCRRARADGTVVLLSGQGADELYHGYRSHTAIRRGRAAAAVPLPMVRAASAIASAVIERSGISATATPRRVAKMLRFLGSTNAERILALADWASPGLREEIMSPAILSSHDTVYAEYLQLFEQSRAASDEERWSYVLFKTFLPALNLTYGDRTSMAVSLEMRVPYLDRALIEQAGRMPVSVKYRDGQQKWILGEASAPWLPPAIRTRSKTGFGAPVREWLKGDLLDWARNILLGDRFLSRGFFQREGIERLFADLASGRRDVAYPIWCVLTFEVWARTFLDNDGSAPITMDGAR